MGQVLLLHIDPRVLKPAPAPVVILNGVEDAAKDGTCAESATAAKGDRAADRQRIVPLNGLLQSWKSGLSRAALSV
jgi:hypothetical protein